MHLKAIIVLSISVCDTKTLQISFRLVRHNSQNHC